MTITEPSTNGQAAPPPPPPAPPAPAVKPERTITRAVAERALPKSKRSKQMLAGAAVIGLVYVGMGRLNRPVHVTVDNDLPGTIKTTSELIQQAISQQPATIVRTGPMSWVGGGCIPNADALNIVGVDPAAPSTWDPVRGASVEEQVKTLLAAGSSIAHLRVTTDTQSGAAPNTARLVVKDGGSDGVPLFDCKPTSTATTADPPATSAPK